MNQTKTCDKCGALIMFIKTRAGKFMPVDAKPLKVVTKDGEVVDGYIPHWSTCSHPDHFRKKIDGINKRSPSEDQRPETK